MPVTIEQNETRSLIRLDGTVDIACAAELKGLLLLALESEREIRISLEEATDLDVTAMQLLCAAEREAKKSGRAISLTKTPPQHVSAALQDAGFASLSIFEMNQREAG